MRKYMPWGGALLLLAAAAGQTPMREATPNDTLKSPEVSADHHVTFRIFAPKASEVTLTGDWLGSAPPPKLTKDEHGVCSVTLGPFEPSLYIHSFTVDGVAVPDPVNPRTKLRARTAASMVEVKDDTPAFWEPRDVPHGAVEINSGNPRSSTARHARSGFTRRLITPRRRPVSRPLSAARVQ